MREKILFGCDFFRNFVLRLMLGWDWWLRAGFQRLLGDICELQDNWRFNTEMRNHNMHRCCKRASSWMEQTFPGIDRMVIIGNWNLIFRFVFSPVSEGLFFSKAVKSNFETLECCVGFHMRKADYEKWKRLRGQKQIAAASTLKCHNLLNQHA